MSDQTREADAQHRCEICEISSSLFFLFFFFFFFFCKNYGVKSDMWSWRTVLAPWGFFFFFFYFFFCQKQQQQQQQKTIVSDQTREADAQF